MTFPDKVEQWRTTVNDALFDAVAVDPDKKSLILGLGLTITGMVDIILALIQKESSGDPRAIGDNGNSIGLLQLNYGAGTPQGVGFTGPKENLTDPYVNCYYGIKVFLGQLDRYKDLDKAILAYNAGSVRTDTSGVPINTGYLTDVLSFLGEKKTSFFWQRSRPAPGGGSVVTGSSIDESHNPAAAPDLEHVTTVITQPAGSGSTWAKVKFILSLLLRRFIT